MCSNSLHECVTNATVGQQPLYWWQVCGRSIFHRPQLTLTSVGNKGSLIGGTATQYDAFVPKKATGWLCCLW